MRRVGWRGLGLGALAALLAGGAALAEHEADPGDEPPAAFEETPPRLAYVDGEVSFSRAGADDWAPARPNLALARGDRLYAGDDANLELQIGPRAFLRAGEGAELGRPPELPIAIDIKPGSATNSINTTSNGKIPVAILSTPAFNAPQEVDIVSLRFGRTGAEHSFAFCSAADDVNRDALPDLVCHFRTDETGLTVGDQSATLRGSTIDGQGLMGTDTVRVLQ